MSQAAVAARESVAYRLPTFVRVCVLPPAGSRACPLDKVIWLTPYEAETIGEDARRAGPGTRLEVIVPPPTSGDRLDAVRSVFAWLEAKGIRVIVLTEADVDPDSDSD
jgi:hypothetical protein